MTEGGFATAAGEFRPPAWLGNPHVQSIFPSLPFRRPGVERRCAPLLRASVEEILDCGDGVRLLSHHATQERLGREPARRLVVLLHGWEGSANSSYMLSLVLALHKAGYAAFRLNLRDHGGTQGLNVELFHSCRIAEVVNAIAAVRALFVPRRLALVGYSLGGNFALRVGARSASAGVALDGIVAICPVLHPPHTMAALETGFWAYRRYYLRKWRRSLLAKAACFPSRYAVGDLRRFKTLTETTDFFVREYTELTDLESYLHGYSILGSGLNGLSVPSRIIASADDPIIPSEDLAALPRNPSLAVTLLPWGGHCGFVTDYRLRSCVDAMVVAELAR